MDNTNLNIGNRVIINKWHHSDELPIPSFGEIVEENYPYFSVKLDVPFEGYRNWYFSPNELSLETAIPDEIPEHLKKEMLDIINSKKPAKHILLDLHDYLTN